MLRRLVNIYRRFDSHVEIRFLETSVAVYHSTQQNVPRCLKLLQCRCENTKFRTQKIPKIIFSNTSLFLKLSFYRKYGKYKTFPDFLSYVETRAKLRTYNNWAQTVTSFVLDGHSDRYQMLSEIALLRVTNLLWFRSCSPLCDTHCLSIAPRT